MKTQENIEASALDQPKGPSPTHLRYVSAQVSKNWGGQFTPIKTHLDKNMGSWGVKPKGLSHRHRDSWTCSGKEVRGHVVYATDDGDDTCIVLEMYFVDKGNPDAYGYATGKSKDKYKIITRAEREDIVTYILNFEILQA